MTVPSPSPLRITIAGASSLLGKEVAELLAASSTPAHELRLLDDAALEGTLTDAGGEPALIHKLVPGSFEGARLVFFTGLGEFTARHWAEAERAGAAVIDLSGGLSGVRTAVPSIPSLDPTMGSSRPTSSCLVRSPSAAVIVAATVSVAVRMLPVRRIAATFFHPVSERGQAGIDELEAQTACLLSFQPIAREVYDAQVAFNLLDRYGDSCRERMEDVRARIARDLSDYLAYRAPMPAIQVIQAPVFYGLAFTVLVEFDGPFPEESIQQALRGMGVIVGKESASNASAAGSAELNVTLRTDANLPMIWWIWGAVDNVRLAAQNAVRIAERICATGH
ncbi:MAG TPA: Asd/ArgC dimerization domain-containing protein [Candidatus Acidoferrales bacterium]|nr:Asd/ArgC dimerization domain-containing protein [Candidatus Acidoferrales bacterium]